MAIFGNLLGGLITSSLSGDGGVGDANRINSMLNNRINNLFREMGQRESMYFRDATGLYQDRAKQVMGSLDRADAQVGQGTRASLRNASDQSQQANASITQNLLSRGLGNSSLAGNAQRGVASDLARNVGNIYAREGQTRAGLGMNRANVQAGVLGDIARLPLMRNDSTQNRLYNWTQALADQQAQPSGEQNPMAGILGSAGGSLAEGLIGSFFI